MSTQQQQIPSEADLSQLSRAELVRLGAELDGVELVEYHDRYQDGSPADKRAERQVARWFLLAGLLAAAFIGVFIFWPQAHYTNIYQHSAAQQWLYALYTPLLGLTLGGAIFAVGIGVMAIAKRLTPHEVAIQKRHTGPSALLDRKTLGAEVADAAERTGLKRRSMLKGSLAFGGGLVALAAAVPILGGLIRNPWDKGAKSDLWVTGWAPGPDGKKVRLAQVDGTPVRPEDLAAASMITCFPAVPGGVKMADSAVMLIRLRSNEAVKIRAGHAGFEYGDLYAYSKICTHVGCPTSLYEAQTGRILCPCHQSQFDAHDGARPVFGPATRPLPQLPLAIDDEGYLVASGDFIEAVGPGFWENGKYPAWESAPKSEMKGNA